MPATLAALCVRKAGLGLAHEAAEIELRFDKLILSDGRITGGVLITF